MRGVCGRKEVEGIARERHRTVADMSTVAVCQQVVGTQRCKQTTKLIINSKLIDKGLSLYVNSHYLSKIESEPTIAPFKSRLSTTQQKVISESYESCQQKQKIIDIVVAINKCKLVEICQLNKNPLRVLLQVVANFCLISNHFETKPPANSAIVKYYPKNRKKLS